MLSVYPVVETASILLVIVTGFALLTKVSCSDSKFKCVHFGVLSFSIAELLYLCFVLPDAAHYRQAYFAIATQILWSCVYLYMSARTISLADDNAALRAELDKHLHLYEEIKSLALCDGLTNIANRRNFDMFLKTELGRAATLGRPVSLILLDLDKFKHYNDTFGHLTGDKVLAQVGRILRKSARPGDLPARYGGEEFSIILPDTKLGEAVAIAENLRRVIAADRFPAGGEAEHAALTASFGIASYDPSVLERAPDAEKIISIADKALYKAKQQGRDRVCGATIFQ